MERWLPAAGWRGRRRPPQEGGSTLLRQLPQQRARQLAARCTLLTMRW